MASDRIRESVIAGSWYPAEPDRLKRQINGYLSAANPNSIEGELFGIISPHAGYMYSGGIAAYAYKLLQERPFKRILILAPSHHSRFPGSSIYNLGGYRTPLGVVPLDHELIKSLGDHGALIKYNPDADLREHSLEIQLPFLQMVLPRFTIIPVTMGDQSLDYCRRLADAIVSACGGKGVLMVASTDLSHYHPNDEAKRIDRVFLERLAAFDPEGLSEEIVKHGCEACGAGPVLTLLLATARMGADTAEVLRYSTSGEITGETGGGVVGYVAAAVYKNKAAAEQDLNASGRPGTDLGFSREEKDKLRQLAYNAIRSRCLGEPMPDISIESERLSEPRGAFVCLHKGTELRGCIGVIEPRGPLWEMVGQMAVESAFGDPRFCALTPDEMNEIDIEISVLTPLQRITDPDRIEVGKHGLYIRKGHRAGLLLPQVAVEHGWNRKEFLEWTCNKAGLAKKAWKDNDTEIHIFSADVF